MHWGQIFGGLATEHFLERGFRHFAWAPFLDDVINAERYRGFANRLARENLLCHLLPPADTRHRVQAFVEELQAAIQSPAIPMANKLNQVMAWLYFMVTVQVNR